MPTWVDDATENMCVCVCVCVCVVCARVSVPRSTQREPAHASAGHNQQPHRGSGRQVHPVSIGHPPHYPHTQPESSSGKDMRCHLPGRGRAGGKAGGRY